MSRVFLAEETRLGRQVVIKVLPPEMGAGVNAERFEREIQLAARLQHPHIVPLLTAGAAGDLLYYIMPFVEGESLRASSRARASCRGRGGPHPPRGGRRAGLRARARRGAPRHQAGQRPAVRRARASSPTSASPRRSSASQRRAASLTSLGVALGTPAYMAPEQAAADPHVDHRADIYAVGVLAYEMLARTAAVRRGHRRRRCWRRTSPRRRSRVVPAPADRPAGARRGSSCAASRSTPADRWQSAAELAAQLEARRARRAAGPRSDGRGAGGLQRDRGRDPAGTSRPRRRALRWPAPPLVLGGGRICWCTAWGCRIGSCTAPGSSCSWGCRSC